MKKSLVGAWLFLLLGVVVVPFAPSASAEVATYAEDTWGVYNSVTSGTLTDSIDSEVMAIEQIGNVVYVGGKFTQVRSTSNGSSVSHNYLAAFNAQTGAYIPAFNPGLDRPVYALQASPDGTKLFVGGEFGDVGGVPNTKALVALNPTTGAVDTSWKAQLKLAGRAVVYTLDLDANWLYVGGTFSAVGGANGVPQISVSRAVKLDLGDAHPDTAWHPTVSGGAVWGIAVAPTGTAVYLSGYFSSVNGLGGTEGFVGVDNTTGATVLPGRLPHNNNGRKHYLDVVAVNSLVFVAGMEHITYVLNASNLSVRTMHSTGGTNNAGFQMGGDYQDLEVVGDRVYAACHCRNEHFADGDIYRILIGGGGSYSRRDPIKFVAAYSAIDGSYIPSFQLDVSGSSGVWAVHGSPNGCVWFGGDLTRATRSNGTNQARGGFTKHCDPNIVQDTQRPSTPTGLTVQANGTTANLAWTASTDNVGVTDYQIFRSPNPGQLGNQIGTGPSTTYSDSGLPDGDFFYYVKAVDAAGNTSWRSGFKSTTIGGVLDTERPSTATGLVALVTQGSNDVVLSWNAASDNVGVTAYRLYRSTTANGVANLVASSPSTAFTDASLADGSYWYYVRAVDAAGNEGWRTAKAPVVVGGAALDTERPTTPAGLLVQSVGTTTVELTWTASSDNVGVDHYVVLDSNGTVVATSTTTTVTVVGLSPAATYGFSVKAEDAAGNRSWRSNIQSVTTA